MRLFSSSIKRNHINTLITVNSDFGSHTILSEAKLAGWNTVAIRPEKSTKLPIADQDFPVSDIMDTNNIIKMIENIISKNRNNRYYIHLGYGYHSEKYELNKALSYIPNVTCLSAKAELVKECGDKRQARILAESLNIPLIPGYHKDDTNLDTLIKEWRRLGDIIMIKTPDGGGGKGNRVVNNKEQLEKALSELGYNVILESFLTGNYKQIEAQIFITNEGPIYLNPRDCSELNKRFQKQGREISCRKSLFIENIPFAKYALKYQKLLGVNLYERGYRGPITAEFLINIDNGQTYFIELNSRLQVEHHTSGITSGVNILTLQRLMSSGESIDDHIDSLLDSKQIKTIKTYNIEDKLELLEKECPEVCVQVRWYGQDLMIGSNYDILLNPINNKIEYLELPKRDNAHVETFLQPGMEIDTTYVDGMIGIFYGYGKTIQDATKNVHEIVYNTKISINTNKDLSDSWLLNTFNRDYKLINLHTYGRFVDGYVSNINNIEYHH